MKNRPNSGSRITRLRQLYTVSDSLRNFGKAEDNAYLRINLEIAFHAYHTAAARLRRNILAEEYFGKDDEQ